MGIICFLTRVDAPVLERLLNDREFARFYYGIEPPVGLLVRLGRVLGLAARAQPPDDSQAPGLSEDATDVTDLDKAWDGLHFLLTETYWDGEPPTNYLLDGGEVIEGIDSWGECKRVLRPHEVRDFADFLTSLTREELQRRFDPKKMKRLGLYGLAWDETSDHDFEYLWEYFEDLRDFIVETKAQGRGVIISMP